MTMTQDADRLIAARQKIVERIEHLSLDQLEQLLSLISSLETPSNEGGGEAFIARMRALRDEFHVTDEEFDEFDRIVRESDKDEKRSIAPSNHESALFARYRRRLPGGARRRCNCA
jgi:hypothetical protein